MPKSHVFWISLALLLASSFGHAAEIGRSQDSACVLSLSGEIVQGDYDRFLQAAAGAYPDEIMESTANNTICLDSPGGSLSEGVKFARHFYEKGVGTVIPDGAGCYSACAIMFMMGTAQGPEVAFGNRKLHIGGTLGFHRPYLNIPAGKTVDARTLTLAYDAAYDDALDLISIANSKAPWSNTPMMQADLIQGMLSHLGDDMLLIDTVDKASRFEIETFGYDKPTQFNEANAFYACENALQWQGGLTKEDITFTEEVARPSYSEPRVTQIDSFNGLPVYQVIGLADGYATERCVIYQEGAYIKGCGEDQTTDTRLGAGACGKADYREKAEFLPPLARLNPSIKLASLRGGRSSEPQNEGGTVNPDEGGLRCYVRANGETIDNDPCQITSADTSGQSTVYNFIWPSGAKTVLVQGPTSLELNGIPTFAREVEGFGTCFSNRKSGRDFCFSAAD